MLHNLICGLTFAMAKPDLEQSDIAEVGAIGEGIKRFVREANNLAE